MIIFDLDGTLRNIDHRLHYILDKDNDLKADPDWETFFSDCSKDKPIGFMIENLRQYAVKETVAIWASSSDLGRKPTLKWLAKHGGIFIKGGKSKYAEIAAEHPKGMVTIDHMKMRKNGAKMHDKVLKRSWLKKWNEANENDPVTKVFEDRNAVVDMFREQGVECIQVAEGDF